jgi:hypothetical protein
MKQDRKLHALVVVDMVVAVEDLATNAAAGFKPDTK